MCLELKYLTGKVAKGVVSPNYFFHLPGFDFFTLVCNDPFHNVPLGTTKYIFYNLIKENVLDDKKVPVFNNVVKDSQNIMLPRELQAHSNSLQEKKNLMKGVDYLNFQLYTSLPLFFNNKVPKDVIDFWFVFTDIYGKCNSKSYNITIEWLEEQVDTIVDNILKTKDIFGYNRVTSKMHCLEHLPVEVLKWGFIKTHTTAPGESALRKLKAACIFAKRTMVTSIINFICTEFKVSFYKSILPFFDKFTHSKSSQQLISIKRIYEAINHNPKLHTKPGNVKINIGPKHIQSKKRHYLLDLNKIVTPTSFDKHNCIVEFQKGKFGSIVAINDEFCYYNPIKVISKNLESYNLLKIKIDTGKCKEIQTFKISQKLILFPTSTSQVYWLSRFY